MRGLKLIVLAFLPIAFGSCASTIDQQEIPSVVINAVMTKYPEAKDLDWEVEAGIYEVAFDLGKDDYEVWVNADGTILKVAQEIRNAQVPAAIRSKLKTDYPDFKLDDVNRIGIGKAVYYKIELDGTFGDQTVVYSASGEKQDPSVLIPKSK